MSTAFKTCLKDVYKKPRIDFVMYLYDIYGTCMYTHEFFNLVRMSEFCNPFLVAKCNLITGQDILISDIIAKVMDLLHFNKIHFERKFIFFDEFQQNMNFYFLPAISQKRLISKSLHLLITLRRHAPFKLK